MEFDYCMTFDSILSIRKIKGIFFILLRTVGLNYPADTEFVVDDAEYAKKRPSKPSIRNYRDSPQNFLLDK